MEDIYLVRSTPKTFHHRIIIIIIIHTIWWMGMGRDDYDDDGDGDV